jgi:hypothetical protein
MKCITTAPFSNNGGTHFHGLSMGSDQPILTGKRPGNILSFQNTLIDPSRRSIYNFIQNETQKMNYSDIVNGGRSRALIKCLFSNGKVMCGFQTQMFFFFQNGDCHDKWTHAKLTEVLSSHGEISYIMS